MSLSLKVSELFGLFPDAHFDGNVDLENLSGIASLQNATSGDLSFLGNPKYKSLVKNSNASIILLPKDYDGEPKSKQIFLRLENPSLGLADVCKVLEEKLFPPVLPGVHPTAFVEKNAKVHESVSIGAFSYIGSNAQIGPHCQLGTHCHVGTDCSVGEKSIFHPGVKLLARCEIGRRVILNAGVVIGSEGYGFDQSEGAHLKTPHLGKVIVEDDVEIGSNTCIDRARFEETKVGEGSKLDNLVQVGHNVRIGKNCLIVAQVGISGSVTMDDNVIVGGQAGFAGHLTVGKGAKIAGQSGITKDVEPGAFLKGNPALPFHLAQRIADFTEKIARIFQ